jgi:hypothetical protein
MSRRIRESLKKRVAFSQKWNCNFCNSMLPSSYQIDHIVPFAIYGDNSETNLEALCPTCHANKTQSEAYRIKQFSKLLSETSGEICWYCFENLTNDHNCNKELVDMDTILERGNVRIKEFKEICKKYSYIMKHDDELEACMKKLMLDTTLKIYLYETSICVNNYSFPVSDYTVENIAKAVFLGTRTKSLSNVYTEVEFYCELDEFTKKGERFLMKNKATIIPSRILNKDAEIVYYIIKN